MKPPGSGPESQSEMNTPQTPLLPGLPNDIAMLCLSRVPRKFHGTLRCVSTRWRDLVSSKEWRLHREKHNLSESWIYALCRDNNEKLGLYVLDPNTEKRAWKRVQDPPSHSLKRKGVGIAACCEKIYLMGGSSWTDTTDQVYYYDATSNSWNEAAPMPTPRSYFSCEALNNTIYAIGGIGGKDFELSWDTYNSLTNTWNPRTEASIVPDIDQSVVLEGKIYILCGSSASQYGAFVAVYETSNGRWQHTDMDLAFGWRGPAVVIDGSLYVLDQESGTKLMMWRMDSREWVSVGRLSALLTQPPCQLGAIGKKVFVVGKGLSTVVVDVGSGVSKDGVLVSSSIPKMDHDECVISCKSVTI